MMLRYWLQAITLACALVFLPLTPEGIQRRMKCPFLTQQLRAYRDALQAETDWRWMQAAVGENIPQPQALAIRSVARRIVVFDENKDTAGYFKLTRKMTEIELTLFAYCDQ